MKKYLLLLLIGIASCVAAAEKPLIVPTPKQMSSGAWNITISSKVKPAGQIVVSKKSPLLDSAAKEINKYIVKHGGRPLPVLKTKKSTGINIILSSGWKNIDLKNIKIPKNKRGDQAYIIRFNNNDILLAGKGDGGTLYAAISFCHLLKKNNRGKVLAYRTAIDDYPDFNYRGDGNLGGTFVTRGSLFNQRRLHTDKSYPEMVKEYIDFCLHLKLNIIFLVSPYKNLIHRGVDYTEEFIRYSKARGFTLSNTVYASFFSKSTQTDKKAIKAYMKKNKLTRHDFMSHIGRWFAWSDEKLIRKMVRDKAIKGVNIYYHCPDTGDENWSKRGNRCRKKFGSDRAKADAFVINTIYDEMKKLNPGDKNIKLYAIAQPYHTMYLDPEFYKYYDEYVEFYQRLNKMVPKEISFCIRETGRGSLKKWIKTMPGRPFYLYYEPRQFMGSTQILASNIRCARSAYFPKRKNDLFCLKAGSKRWELDSPIGALYSWDSNAPGSGLLDYNNKYEFNKDGKVNKKFLEVTVPETVRFTWGEAAAKIMLKAYSSRLDIGLTTSPEKNISGINRRYHKKSKQLLDKLSSAFFKRQEKAASICCRATLKIMKGKVPVNYDFLRARATRLYKHAMVVKLIAPIYFHYYSAMEAVERRDRKTAEREIKAAFEMSRRAKIELVKQKLFVKQFSQVSPSFMAWGLRNKKPFSVAAKKLKLFKIPKNLTARKNNLIGSIEKSTQLIFAVASKHPPKIDGRLNDSCWRQNKYPVTGFVRYPFTGKSVKADNQTVVKICYDKKNLYIAINALDLDYDSIMSKELKRDNKAIFKHDIVEIFINTNPKNINFSQFVINASGSVFDVFTKQRENDLGRKELFVESWNPDWKRATLKVGAGWVTEVAIPFAAFNKAPVKELASPPKAGDRWRVYFSRERRGLELSGVKFMRNGRFSTVAQYPYMKFIKAGK
jgi:Carbohydrate family 9 binding domain-like/Glycosyl hydrolase family 20, domain 2